MVGSPDERRLAAKLLPVAKLLSVAKFLPVAKSRSV